MIEQVSVFLENDPGALAHMTELIADASINMHVLAVADTTEFGIARIICDDPRKACACLTQAGFSATLTPVCGVELEDEPGSLAKFLRFAVDKGFDIAYSYCFVEPSSGHAINIFRFDDPLVEQTIAESGFKTVSEGDLGCA